MNVAIKNKLESKTVDDFKDPKMENNIDDPLTCTCKSREI